MKWISDLSANNLFYSLTASMPNATVNKCWSPPLPQMVGGGPSQGQQMGGNNIPTNGAGPKPMGRPIVKGGGMEGNMGAGGGGGASNEFLVQQFHQHMMMQQQQQHRQAMENQKMQQLLHQLQQQQQQQQRMMASGGGGVGGSVGGPSGPSNAGVGPVGAQMRGGMPFPGQSNPGQANAQLRAIVGSGGGGAGNVGGGGGAGGGVNSLANMSE